MLLADFHDPEEAARWRSTDDVVMGGQSSSEVWVRLSLAVCWPI